MKQTVAYTVLVGSLRSGQFAWGRVASDAPDEVTSGKAIDALVDALATDLSRNIPVSVGFAAPLAIPLRDDPANLTAARAGESGQVWSSGAGPSAITNGIVEAVWIFTKLKAKLEKEPPAFLGLDTWKAIGRGVFVHELLLSERPKGFKADALAEHAARQVLGALDRMRSPRDPEPVINVIGAALVRAGWAHDARMLESPPIVVPIDTAPAPPQTAKATA